MQRDLWILPNRSAGSFIQWNDFVVDGWVYLLRSIPAELVNPQPVAQSGVIIVGAAGLIVNLFSAWLLHGHTDLNLRAAYYHVIMDALGSVAALLSGILIAITKWYRI